MQLPGVHFQLANWPILTELMLPGGIAGSGNFRLQHWPPLEAKPLCLPSLAALHISVRSDAIGLLQLEHTILSLMLNTAASCTPKMTCSMDQDPGGLLRAKTCNK